MNNSINIENVLSFRCILIKKNYILYREISFSCKSQHKGLLLYFILAFEVRYLNILTFRLIFKWKNSLKATQMFMVIFFVLNRCWTINLINRIIKSIVLILIGTMLVLNFGVSHSWQKYGKFWVCIILHIQKPLSTCTQASNTYWMIMIYRRILLNIALILLWCYIELSDVKVWKRLLSISRF